MSVDRRPPHPTPHEPVAATGVGDGPIVVVTGIALNRSAREALAQRLGPGHVVVDIRDAGNTADIVLIPPASGNLIGAIRAMFPQAQVLITEFTDHDFNANFSGPIRRSIDSGVDGYFVVPSIDDLAAVTHETTRRLPRASLTAATDASKPGSIPPPNLIRQLTASDQTASDVHIDLQEWANALGVAAESVIPLAWPMLSQLQQQGFRITLAGLSDRTWIDRANEVGITIET